MSAPHADDRAPDRTEHPRNGHPAADVLDGPALPHPRPAPGPAAPTGPVHDPAPGPRTPPMPWPAVPPAGAPVPRVYPDGRAPEVRDRAGWRRAVVALREVDLRGTVPHRAAAVAVGATLALALGVVVTAYAGTGAPDAAPPPAPVPPPADLVAGSTAADPAAFGEVATFTSPSGNIACRIGAGEARCDVQNRRWSAEGTDGCTDAGLAVGRGGATRASCDGVPVPADGTALGYGTHLTRGDLTCVSRRTGVECRDATSGHGFRAARASYRLY